MAKKSAYEQIEQIELDKIDPPDEIVRIEIDPEEVSGLAESIQMRGLKQAIRVVKKGPRYKIIFGHRRYLACVKLGYKKIKAVVVKATKDDILLDRAIENIQRVDLTPLEEAQSYQALVDKMGVSFEKIAKLTGKSPGAVKRALDILKMPDYMQRELHKKTISKAVAEELNSCPDDAYKKFLVEMASEHGVTKMIARQWVLDYRKALRSKESAGEGGTPLLFTREQEPVYVTCFLCRGAVDVLKAKNITVCPQCQGELTQILSKQD